jgi:hypothetical protein
MSLRTTLAAEAHLAERQYLLEERTLNIIVAAHLQSALLFMEH